MDDIIRIPLGETLGVRGWGSDPSARRVVEVVRHAKSSLRTLLARGRIVILTGCPSTHDRDPDLAPTERYLTSDARYVRSHARHIAR